jgi:hypothetical protein
MYFKTANVAGLRLFYREARDSSKPTIVLLHGFPFSSDQFHDIIPLLAARFHVIAADYPGIGFLQSQEKQTTSWLATKRGKNELVIVSFDPLDGPGKELLRIPLEAATSGDIGFDYVWQLSSDGSRIGIVKRHGNQIRRVPLGGGQARTITVKNYPDLMDLNWAIDSQSMFVSTLEPGGASVLHVDLNGNAQAVWQQPQSVFTWGFPSPDGRQIQRRMCG